MSAQLKANGFEQVPQLGLRGSTLHPAGVMVALSPAGKAPVRFRLTVGGKLAARLGWKKGTRVGLEVGRGEQANTVRVLADPDGRPLRPVPRSPHGALMVGLNAGPLEAWEAPRMEAQFVALDAASGLLIFLPWDLPEAAADAAGDA